MDELIDGDNQAPESSADLLVKYLRVRQRRLQWLQVFAIVVSLIQVGFIFQGIDSHVFSVKMVPAALMILTLVVLNYGLLRYVQANQQMIDLVPHFKGEELYRRFGHLVF